MAKIIFQEKLEDAERIDIKESEVPGIQEVTIEEAKNMIFKYFESHDRQSIYPSDVAGDLDLDLEITINAMNRLVDEGRLEVADE